MRRLLCAGVLSLLLLLRADARLGASALVGPPRPTALPVVATQTLQPTNTLAPTGTVPPTNTAIPTQTLVPTSTAIPTGPPPDGSSGWCLLGCFSWADFFSSIGNGLFGWITSGINDLVNGLASLLSGVVRVDTWSGLHGFFTFMLTVAGGVAGALAVLGALKYYRSTLPGGHAVDGGSGLSLLTRTLESAILLLGLPWGVGQLLSLLQSISDTVSGYSGVTGADLLISIISVFTNPGLSPITLVVGFVAMIVYLLLLLVKLGSIAVLAWLYVLAPLCAATWPLGAGIMGTWLRNFVSVALWGVGWSVWLKIGALTLSDYAVDPLFKPFLALAILLIGYGVPRMVDSLLSAAMARASGAYALAGGVIGGAMVIAGGGASVVRQRVASAIERMI